MSSLKGSCSGIFESGKHEVVLLRLEPTDEANKPTASAATVTTLKPPKPLLIVSPTEPGHYPVLVFLHGYLLYNSFYSQLLRHIASHGFILVAPQMYIVAGPDSSEEIKCAAATMDWFLSGLPQALPTLVRPDLDRVAVAGHSRGGKVAFALALALLSTNTHLKFSALIGIDPVDGMDKGKQTFPPVLTYNPHSFIHLKMPVLVIGSGLGELKKNPLFPPCAPKGVNHEDFFSECCGPAWHFVADNYGHLDMLDDETKGLRGRTSYCLCKNGKAREPMRKFVGGVVVAFMRAYFRNERRDLEALREDPRVAPVELRPVGFLNS